MNEKIPFLQADIATLEPNQEYTHYLFDELDMQNVDVSECVFTDCSFEKTNLRGAKCNGATFVRSNLSNALLQGVNFFSAKFVECKLLGTTLSQASSIIGTEFTHCNFDYADLRGLDLSGYDFSNSSFIETDLSLANLEKTSFINSQFIHTNTNGAKLMMTDLRGATLQGIQLWKTNLKGMIVTPEQLQSLAQEMGITVLESDKK